eukprot:TRINITY_DN58344_c0_g1_i1.p1 TRINITY_DN58344_c0_g1~~TRINITY_DN58344_c0_g1_i1.p1  ORF type:complete len:133 (+),score=34.90 TRINITY_DN58344_c0_g1_i1:17-415(+)
MCIIYLFIRCSFFFSSRRRHTRCREVSWARRCVQETDINQWVRTKGNNFIYIYGGNDPWQAPGVVLNGKTNSLKMVLENGSHATRIRHFSNEDKEKIFSALETWLDVKIERDCLDKKKQMSEFVFYGYYLQI